MILIVNTSNNLKEELKCFEKRNILLWNFVMPNLFGNNTLLLMEDCYHC